MADCDQAADWGLSGCAHTKSSKGYPVVCTAVNLGLNIERAWSFQGLDVAGGQADQVSGPHSLWKTAARATDIPACERHLAHSQLSLLDH